MRKQGTKWWVASAVLGLAVLGGSVAQSGGMKPVQRILVWSGETPNKGEGWSTPNTEKMYLKVQNEVAHSGKHALVFHVEAEKQWAECGWEWLGWWPPTRGTDISSAKTLTFWIRVTGEHRPHDLNVALKSSNQQRQLPTVNVRKYVSNYADGKWHRVRIPLRDMFIHTQEFDPKKASQLFMGTWNEKADFSVYVDDISFI